MKRTARILRVFALLAGLGLTLLLTTTAAADGEEPSGPTFETWPGKVVCGGEFDGPDTVCYTVPDIACRMADGVLEDCVVRKPEPKPEPPPP